MKDICPYCCGDGKNYGIGNKCRMCNGKGYIIKGEGFEDLSKTIEWKIAADLEQRKHSTYDRTKILMKWRKKWKQEIINMFIREREIRGDGKRSYTEIINIIEEGIK